jgi:hypothetical protein
MLIKNISWSGKYKGKENKAFEGHFEKNSLIKELFL